jgi:hypothetical protein
MNPAAFVADLIQADLSVLASPSGNLDLYARQMVLDRDGCSYRDVPRHPDADRMADRFDALTESERAGIAGFVRALPRNGSAEGPG